MFRLREKDFEEYRAADGISPAWPVSYKEMEPFYTEAEKLYHVHGKMGLDPTEPFKSEEYPYPEVSHEPRIQLLNDELLQKGLHPFYLPLGVKLNEANRIKSPCICCNTCDGFPCLIHAKSDADINCVRPSLDNENVTLLTSAKALKFNTSESGREVVSVNVETIEGIQHFTADLFIVSCGAINSAALLLASANSAHPAGLANSSDQVGRNYIKHNSVAMMSISTKPNHSIF